VIILRSPTRGSAACRFGPTVVHCKMHRTVKRITMLVHWTPTATVTGRFSQTLLRTCPLPSLDLSAFINDFFINAVYTPEFLVLHLKTTVLLVVVPFRFKIRSITLFPLY